MKKTLMILFLGALGLAGCTTKDNSFKTAPGNGIAEQNGGVQTTGSPASDTAGAASASATPMASPAH